jgi:hypothetical protein
MGFSTKECAWKHVTVKILGRTLVGIRGYSFEKNIDKEYLRASGDEPIDIQTGDKSYPMSITLLKYEVDMLNDAALAAGYEDILEVPHEAVTLTCQFKKRITDTARTITASGIAFTSLKAAMETNGKFTPVDLPALSMKTTIR